MGKKIDNWQLAWRKGIAAILSTRSLETLRTALISNDRRLVQGAIALPNDVLAQDLPAYAACAIGYCGWQGEGLKTVAEVEEFFASVCVAADQRLGEPAGCWFFNWFDKTPREEVRQQLLTEVNRSLKERAHESL